MFAAVETPAVLIDLTLVEQNLQRAQAYADAHRLALRPHIKTHKLARFARRQVEIGAVGITCQKLGEAEVMADAGLTDIFLPYNILGQAKLARLKALAGRVRLSVTADSAVTVAGLAATFTDAGAPLAVLVECDTGMGRCGVQAPADALALARTIAAAPGLRFAGLMTYPAAGKAQAAAAWLAEAKALLSEAGLPPAIVSSGGTPDMWHAADAAAVVTEYRPGTYIYLDRYQVAKGVGSLADCALTVLATVVSRPTETRAIIDAGSKTLTSDTLGMDGYGLVLGYPEAVITGLSEEHGTIDLSACPARPAIGERLRIVPNHACVVSNLFDRVVLVRGDDVVETAKVDARGRVD
ncbi:D-TA family PLP-dependent enzyme [Labrys wisconsinensis]|uniref:D-serine deaminase-like pyridoxal phosphate-dependent protein n=1 Tax=Labrys wisconsinensis TaxID=425677 RepID=A0ABU0JDS1_9HYPH|nr:D-TA family PLP-dependent enzyme [Labrys wisconsinensis]MDQ0471765.1 D-serine deaminase-like pyridoxal phosphate-dependent protein [Labrys wisconsinensis]